MHSDLYINEFWEDPALVFDYMNPCKNNISFDDKVLQRLWIPNTCEFAGRGRASAQVSSTPRTRPSTRARSGTCS